MNVNSIDGNFSTEYFALGENNQPVCTDRFLLGLQVLATQATSAINNHKAVEEAFERIQVAKWEHISTEAKKIVDQRIQDVRQAWVKVCFNKQFRHVSREHLKKNCGPKFHAQYSNPMKDATQLELNLLPPNGFLADDNSVLADDYDQTIIKEFLDYIQTGTLSESALNDNILQLFILTHQHQIEGLIIKCTDFLKEQLDDHENLDTIWEFANEQKIPQLKFACLSYMQANQDKISKELKEKYEKALPVVKALFANEIILNHSPSGNIEVRVEIFNEETASHIEQLSKLFSIRSLVISEQRVKKLMNISEKLFPFLTEISPMLKDLEELIIWNETPKDNDFLILRDLYPNLTAFGNDAHFLKTFEEVKTYLNNFRNPDEDDQESEKLTLRSLNLSSLNTLDDVQMAEFTPHLQELYHINITSEIITSVVAPKATVIYCQCCTALTTLEAPEATEIHCESCTALTTLEAPEATEIHCSSCTALTNIIAPKATEIDCQCCTALITLDAAEATMISCSHCTSLTTIKAPEATGIHCSNCTALTTIDAPEAKHIICNDCKSLITIKAPKATGIHCNRSTSLTSINAPEATGIHCQGCTALTTIEAPNATVIDCQGCTALTTIDAPEATEIYCNHCITLTNIKAPKATIIYCNGCTALTTIEALEATVIYSEGCEALTTINAPEAAVINCRGCEALETVD